MSRRHAATKRTILPDAKYGDLTVAKFINYMIKAGKKSASEQIMYSALDIVEKKTKRNPLEVLKETIENVKPTIEVSSRRVGGATYQVPVEVRHDRQLALALRWMINASRARGEKTMFERLAGEMVDAFHNRGGAVKKREDTHKMAEANKAFSHYRW